ncbi:DUF2059 domain-containing protein [Myroides guanonis]|uniref:DUF2059 domain-containing protein n=1 Tax=Myroides guanonis TaxID=1150112 RepID=A0A1I3SVE7_9FLAO|nr:DUF2059 domain-containing protein [Myroides guanonis]SFJ61551.1 hypothetical protein SAMN04487893_11161 [Myroides guanonis]
MKKVLITLTLALFVQVGFAQDTFKEDVKKYFSYSGQSAGLEIVKNDLSSNVPAEKKVAFEKELDVSLNNLIESLADLYMSEFTHEEIKQINAFYETPVGKKLSSKNEFLLNKGQEISGEWSQGLIELMGRYMN